MATFHNLDYVKEKYKHMQTVITAIRNNLTNNT